MSLIIAHRGASGYAPENTMPAFEKALEMKAEGIELDVHMTKDGEIVVIHDHNINRTSDGKGFIKDLKLAEVKEYDFGAWFDPKYKGSKIPTLKEVLELLKDWDGLLNIEIKSGPNLYEGIEDILIDMVEEYNFQERVIFSSFNHYSLKTIKEIDPSIKTGLLYSAIMIEPWLYADKYCMDALHPHFYSVTPELVEGCKKSDIRLNPYTIDEIADLERMVTLGVDSIITDYPDRALKVRERMKGF